MAPSDPIIINEAQLILAEKRTYLAMLRTGLGILALPLAVVSFLIVASKYYDVSKVLAYLVPLMIVCVVLTALASWIIYRSVRKLRHAERMLVRLKAKNPILDEVMD